MGLVVQRVALFQGAAKAATGTIEVELVHSLIQRYAYKSSRISEDGKLKVGRYLSRNDNELADIKSQRRPGRPSSTREDLLKLQIEAEDREYDNGFWTPEMQDESNLEMLRRWDGSWGSLNTIKYVRLSRSGEIRQSIFPPKGES